MGFFTYSFSLLLPHLAEEKRNCHAEEDSAACEVHNGSWNAEISVFLKISRPEIVHKDRSTGHKKYFILT
jgi:hypothetical protein